VIKPTQTEIYRQVIPFEIYGTDRTGSMEAAVQGVRLVLRRRSRHWWVGELPLEAAWQGGVSVKISARDGKRELLAQKEFTVHVPPGRELKVRFIGREPSYYAGDRCQLTVRVEDAQGRAQSDLPLRIGINQTADMWGRQLLHGTTDERGEYHLFWGPLAPGHVTVMATVDQESQDLIEPGVIVVPVNKE